MLQNTDENGPNDERRVSNKTQSEEVKGLMKQIKTLKISTEKNKVKKDLMNLQLLENIANAKKIRDSIPKKIKFKDKRNYLELVIKNHVLELQNIELEINLQIQEKTMLDLKNIIESQKKIILEHNLDHKHGENNDQNMVSYNSEQDLDIDIEDMMYDDDVDPEAQINDGEEDDELNEIYKEILEKGINNENKRPSKNDPFPEINQQPPGRSGKEKQSTSKHQVKNSQERIQPSGNANLNNISANYNNNNQNNINPVASDNSNKGYLQKGGGLQVNGIYMGKDPNANFIN